MGFILMGISPSPFITDVSLVCWFHLKVFTALFLISEETADFEIRGLPKGKSSQRKEDYENSKQRKELNHRHFVAVRLTDVELNLLDQGATCFSISRSEYLRKLLLEHDEKTGKKILDESGRSILRKEFYMDGLNCDPMSFDKECELTNAHFHKNKKREDIKSHHYIISYDPTDVTENGLTGEEAQAISLELAKQMFPGYQALVVTHTDGHNESGNIHTHIVINSVRKSAVERQPYMDKPHEEAAGYKHRSTDKFMNAFKKTVMERCQQEGLHQIDLLAPAERKITQKEYMTQKHAQLLLLPLHTPLRVHQNCCLLENL